jgi:hypothetical protein
MNTIFLILAIFGYAGVGLVLAKLVVTYTDGWPIHKNTQSDTGCWCVDWHFRNSLGPIMLGISAICPAWPLAILAVRLLVIPIIVPVFSKATFEKPRAKKPSNSEGPPKRTSVDDIIG